MLRYNRRDEPAHVATSRRPPKLVNENDKCERAARIIHMRIFSFDLDPLTNIATSVVCSCGWASGKDALAQHEIHIADATSLIRGQIDRSQGIGEVV